MKRVMSLRVPMRESLLRAEGFRVRLERDAVVVAASEDQIEPNMLHLRYELPVGDDTSTDADREREVREFVVVLSGDVVPDEYRYVGTVVDPTRGAATDGHIYEVRQADEPGDTCLACSAYGRSASHPGAAAEAVPA